MIKYKDKVKIIEGFYEGLIGIAIEKVLYISSPKGNSYKYRIELLDQNSISTSKIITIHEDYLQIIEK